MPLTYRPMQKTDLDAVMSILHRAYAPAYYETKAVIAEKLDLFPRGCWLACDPAPVGYLISHPWLQARFIKLDSTLGSLPAAPDCFYIHDFAILPAYRKKGIATQFFNIVRKLAAGLGLSAILLVSIQNSSGFWQKMGFETVQNLPPADLESLKTYGDDAKVMRASLPR